MSLGVTAGKLRAAGVETIGVVATAADRAQRYFSYRPPRYLVGADPDLASHRAFRVPNTGFSDELAQVVNAKQEGLAREAGISAPAGGVWEALNRADGIDHKELMADVERHQAQRTAQFLIDREGVIRWSNIECERDGLEGIGQFPTDEELLAAARAL